MSKAHQLRCYDYVNRPYDAVRASLRADALGIFERATTSAAHRADDLGPELRARVGSLSIGVPIDVRISDISESTTYGQPSTRLTLEWKAKERAGLFPTMRATLDLYALSSSETQLDLQGTYDPPLGLLGDLGDALVANRIAEAAVARFVQEVAAYLRGTP